MIYSGTDVSKAHFGTQTLKVKTKYHSVKVKHLPIFVVTSDPFIKSDTGSLSFLVIVTDAPF